jgi:hypothetical protein
MDFNEQIIFTGGINTDDDTRSIPQGDYRDFNYCRLGQAAGQGYLVITSWGTIDISNQELDTRDVVVGATIWERSQGTLRSIVYFVEAYDGDDEIWVFGIDSEAHELAIRSSELNFSADFPIFHANAFDEILKFTDGRWDDQMYIDSNRVFNPPYQINLEKALSGYYTNITLRTIDAVKWPPNPPFAQYGTDISRSDNKISKKLFKFSVQYIYENNELSSWSMFSNLPLPDQSEFVTGSNWLLMTYDNKISVSFETGPKEIIGFNVSVQQFDESTGGAEGPFSVFSELNKERDTIGDNQTYTIDFYGNVSTKVAVDFQKNYDRLPISARCQEYLPTSQIAYINFREGYNKISINATAEYTIQEVPWSANGNVYFDSDWTIGSSFFKTVPPWDRQLDFPFVAGMVFSLNGPSSIPVLLSYIVTQEDIDAALAIPVDPTTGVLDRNVYIIQKIGDAFSNSLGFGSGTISVPAPTTDPIFYLFSGSLPSAPVVTSNRSAMTRLNDARVSLKSGATQNFGIVYGDRAFRDGTTQTSDALTLFVPFFYDIDRSSLSEEYNPFTISPKITINHTPPVWADRYWIVAKPSTDILSFGQYMVSVENIYDASSIVLDSQNNNTRYIIYLDNKYTDVYNVGATINHTPQKGDKLRFVRRRSPEVWNNFSETLGGYAQYVEVDVLDYIPGEGPGGRSAVITTLFDISLIENFDTTANPGAYIIEIYTPRPFVDDDGGLFVSQWKDITQAIPIIDPHTPNRRHGAPFDYVAQCINIGGPSDYIFALPGDKTDLIGAVFNIKVYYTDGSVNNDTDEIISVEYRVDNNTTYITFLNLDAASDISYITLSYSSEQQIAPQPVQPADIRPSYGDVYLRMRNFHTGYAGDSAMYYYYIEDPHYSDYWLSDVHNTGRTRIEDPTFKMSHRKADAIHSNPYGGLGRAVNGTSTFVLDNSNIIEMNPLFGEVVRAIMAGREGKTLKCIQPFKENSIYIQFYPNEVGSDSSVRVSKATFASWFDYKSRFGTTDPGSVALLPNGEIAYFDANSGVFVLSQTNGQTIISEIDPSSRVDFKFRTETKRIAGLFLKGNGSKCRAYVNELLGEVGFAFDLVESSESATGLISFADAGTNYFIAAGSEEDILPLLGNEITIYLPLPDSPYNLAPQTTIVDYVASFGSSVVIFIRDPLLYTYSGEPRPVGEDPYYYISPKKERKHVVFDYLSMRWRSTYDYPFTNFVNYGQLLFGWDEQARFYKHNEKSSYQFHGKDFVQKITFVSNERPLDVKRYQNFSQMGSQPFTVEASSEPNLSYTSGMYTIIAPQEMSQYEGYTRCYYKKNLYDPVFLNSAIQSTSFVGIDPDIDDFVAGWELAGNQTGLLGVEVVIIQPNGNFIGVVTSADYDSVSDITFIETTYGNPVDTGIPGLLYSADLAISAGEDMRSYSLTHTLSYPVSENELPAQLFGVAIKGVLS